MESTVSRSPIIVALDYPQMGDALELAGKLDPERCRLKVGMELFTRHGPAIVEKLRQAGFEIFLDLKFHDIPNTVARACAAAADLGVWMVNVHAMGGNRMISEAREALNRCVHQPLLVGVTVLTSLSNEDLRLTGVSGTAAEHMYRLTDMCARAGANGIVCPAEEVKRLKHVFAPPFLFVTPGIRPSGADKHDQTRTMTPAEAINAGSDFLVVGRPITRARDPLKVLEEIESEVNEALAEKK